MVEEQSATESSSARTPDNILKQFGAVDASTYADFSETPQTLDRIEVRPDHRLVSGIAELDRVLGGGIVKGSLVLVGGEPGIGKSTLLLQMAAYQRAKTLYVSGEESVQQIKSRAERIQAPHGGMLVVAETNLHKILQHILQTKPQVVVIDSIQTLYREVPSGSSSRGLV